MWAVYEEGILPDGTQLDYTSQKEAEKNSFAVCDVDGDGREELLINWTNASMAGMGEYVLDCRDGQCYVQLVEFPDIR